jgi:UDP-N-acetylglucosamine 4,6-dehydratase
MDKKSMKESELKLDANIKKFFKDKTILVTGGTGSIGSDIARALAGTGVKAIRILSNDENGVFTLSNELDGDLYRFLVGDVRDKQRMIMACRGVDIVFHAAALKHVPLCEYNPIEAMKTNVMGTQNVVEACIEQNVERMIFISTDKAVEPVNTMGASKLLAEKLVVNANFYKGNSRTVFSIVRFGNVMGSRGSVIPYFIDQVRNGGPVTLTSREMTRFMMFLSDAVRLIFKATYSAKGGEIFTFHMPVARMTDLAEVIRDEVAKKSGKKPESVKIKMIGLRPGERMHEALMTAEEASRAKKSGELIIIPPIMPAIPGMEDISHLFDLPAMKEPYRSNELKPLTRSQIREMLLKLHQI